MVDAIKVQGLSEFTRNLRTLDREAPKALRLAYNGAATLIVEDARPRIPSRTGRARKSVRATSTQNAARVTGGGARVKYYAWLDFGGRVGKGGRIVRPYLKDGRYIYASYERNKPRIAALVEQSLLQAARQAGIEVD